MMNLIQLACDTGFVIGLMLLGSWLETVGGMGDVLDRYFTPFPLGGTGLIIAFGEWAFT